MSTQHQQHTRSPTEQYRQLFEQLYNLSVQQGWGDPFCYARSREILMANHLGHYISNMYSGFDAIDQEGNMLEYKSTTHQCINATYNGISVKPTWEQQLRYLQDDKIAKYKWHFFARFQGARIYEIWKMSGDCVLELLIPKLYAKFHSNENRSDPRLGTSLSTTMIRQYGECIFPQQGS